MERRAAAAGLPRDIVDQDRMFYDAHVNLTGAPATKRPRKTGATTASASAPADAMQGWVCRNGSLAAVDGALKVTPQAEAAKNARTFLTHASLDVPGPVTAAVRLRAKQSGKGGFSWRTKAEKDSTAENVASCEWIASAEWQEVKTELKVNGTLLHLRMTLPRDSAGIEVQSITLIPSKGKPSVFDFSKTPSAP